jgi:hypothetical protein
MKIHHLCNGCGKPLEQYEPDCSGSFGFEKTGLDIWVEN